MKKLLSRKQKATKKTGLPEPDYKALYEYGEGTIRQLTSQIQTMFDNGCKINEEHEKAQELLRSQVREKEQIIRESNKQQSEAKRRRFADTRAHIETTRQLGYTSAFTTLEAEEFLLSCADPSISYRAEENIGGGGKDAV